MSSRRLKTDHFLADPEGQTTSPQPAVPLLAPSNQVNSIHTFHWRYKEDKLSQVSDLSPSWGLLPLSWYLSICLTLAFTHCLVCLPQLVMDEPSYISHTHTQSHSRSFMRASGLSNKSPVFSSQREWGKEEDYSVWLDFAQTGSVAMHFLDCFPLWRKGLFRFNNAF